MLYCRWYKDDDELPGETGTAVALERVARELHGKTITCEARNKVDSAEQTYTLDVECQPSLFDYVFRIMIEI